jgi:hypothetical protein
VSRFVNLTIDILIQNLFSKELDSRLKTVHSGTSANEDISIYNINDFTRHFNIIHHNIYAHYFDDLPCLIWWVTKNRKITFNVIKLIDLIQKSLAVKYSNFKFYILETK